GQGPVFLAVAHGVLVAAVEEIPVGRVDVQVAPAAGVEEGGLPLPVDQLRVIKPAVVFMGRGGAGVAVVGAVGFEDVHAGGVDEPEEPVEVGVAAGGAEAQTVAERAAGVARSGVA